MENISNHCKNKFLNLIQKGNKYKKIDLVPLQNTITPHIL